MPDDTAPTRVLLVEDDAKLARLTARYLESHGLVVTLVPQGRPEGRILGALRGLPGWRGGPWHAPRGDL